MRIFCIAFSLYVSLVIQSCNNGRDEQAERLSKLVQQLRVEPDTTAPDEPFYPYIDYIKQQLAYIDSTPLAVERIVMDFELVTDSGFVDKREVFKWASLFTEVDPNLPFLKPLYRETSYRDLTINRLIFNISAITDTLPLQQADILLNADNQAVKNIILRRHFNQGDTVIDQHLVWVHNMNLQVSEKRILPNGSVNARYTRLIWDRPMN